MQMNIAFNSKNAADPKLSFFKPRMNVRGFVQPSKRKEWDL